MNAAKSIKAAIGGLIILYPLPLLSAPQDLPVKTINVPAYTMINETLLSITPQINGQRNNFLMQQICSIARGEINQQDVNISLQQNGINPETLPRSGSPLSLLVNQDKEQQQMACVSYLATSLLEPVNTEAYTSTQEISENSENKEVKKGKPETRSSWKFWEDKEEEQKQPEAISEKKTINVFDRQKFTQDVQLQMAISQATAQLYVLIAQNATNSKLLSVEDYQNSIKNTVKNYAPEYLRILRHFYASNENNVIEINEITPQGFNIRDSKGRELIRDKDKLLLRYQGVDWFGHGKMLGNNYFFNIQVIDMPEKQTEKKTTPKPTTKNPKRNNYDYY